MSENCVPYKRKTLCLLLTIPMIVLYVAIAVFLWTVHPVFFVIYGALFVLVAMLQSYGGQTATKLRESITKRDA